MKQVFRFSSWGLVLIAAVGCNGLSSPPWANPDNQGDLASLGPAPEPSWAGAASYLVSLFDDQRALVRSAPGATAAWSTNDNALAARAFAYLPVPPSPTSPDQTFGGAIVARLQTMKSCGCNDQPEHDGLTDHRIDPVVNKGAQIPLQPHSACVRTARLVPMAQNVCSAAGAQCPGMDFALRHDDYPENGWIRDACHTDPCTVTAVGGWDEDGVGQGDAELLAMQLLNRQNRGLDTAALWQNLLGKWDGKGMRDRAAVADGRYTTYKLALLKLCSRVLAKPLPEGVEHKLAAAQNAQGGFRATYDLAGEFTLDQAGNAQTTAYVALAYRKPVADF